MAVVLSMLLAACTVEEPAQEPPPLNHPEEAVEAEEDLGGPNPVAQLFRASLDLRGVRPTLEEIDRVHADPDEYEGLVDDFLNDDRFVDRVVNLYTEVFLTRADGYAVGATDYGLPGSDQFAFVRSVGDEPLRILAHIVENELPYTEIVVGDWTMANELLAQAWPLDYPEDETGWKKVHYTDSRPAAGILSTNSMWWRYGSTASNANRGKANAISKILLCNDYLSKTISFDRSVNLLDDDALNDALKTKGDDFVFTDSFAIHVSIFDEHKGRTIAHIGELTKTSAVGVGDVHLSLKAHPFHRWVLFLEGHR